MAQVLDQILTLIITSGLTFDVRGELSSFLERGLLVALRLLEGVDVASLPWVEELANRLLRHQILVRHFHVLHHKGDVARIAALLLAKVDRLELLVLLFQEGVPLLQDAHIFLMRLFRTSGVNVFELGDSDLGFASSAICKEIVAVFGRLSRLSDLLRSVATRDLLQLCRSEGAQATTGAGLLNLISTRGRRLHKQVLVRQLGGPTCFGEGARGLLEVLLLHQSTGLEDSVIDGALCLGGLELIGLGNHVLDSDWRRLLAASGDLVLDLASFRQHLRDRILGRSVQGHVDSGR